MFAMADRLLRRHGASFANVPRTWYYLTDINRNYRQFNASRNAFFECQGVQRLPASTGIRAGLYPPGALCRLDLSALLNPQGARIEVMRATTLIEAPRYGSAFSRGMKLSLPEKTILFISGTASVDETGATAHRGDPRRQIERMLLNVQQLLTPHGADFKNLVHVISYLNSTDHLQLLREILSRRGLTNVPNSIVQADICRPDRLCEMEAIAVLPR